MLNYREELGLESLEGETWAMLESAMYCEYYISNLGRVKKSGYQSTRKSKSGKYFVTEFPDRILKPWLNARGYYSVEIDGCTKRVHVLVAEAFLGHTPTGNQSAVVDHIDNDKHNNTANNLQVTTHRKNSSKDTNGVSEYVGVYAKKSGKWAACISLDKQTTYLGSSIFELECAARYERALHKLESDVEYFQENISELPCAERREYLLN